MRVSEAKELFRSLTKSFFYEANVIFAHQSRTPKKEIPLVVIKPGNVKKPLFPTYSNVDGKSVGYYSCRMPIQVDLFTNGLPVIHDITKEVVAYENTAVDDMLSFSNFINSDYVIEWCNKNDVSIYLESDVQDMTGLVNDTTYEFRSMISVVFNFTQKAVGSAAVYDESSIKYPVLEKNEKTGEIVVDPVTHEPVIKVDPDTKEPLYSIEEPEILTSSTNSNTSNQEGVNHITFEKIEKMAKIIPEPIKTSMGKMAPELVKNDIGYFEKVEIKEES